MSLQIQLLNVTSTIVSTSAYVDLAVMMNSTSWSGDMLTLDFGDGVTRSINLTSTVLKSLYLDQEDQEGAVVAFLGNCDNFCCFEFRFRHMFNYEGEFVPTALIQTNDDFLIAPLDVAITAENILTAVYIQYNFSSIAVDQNVLISVNVLPVSRNVSYIWNIIYLLNNNVYVDQQTDDNYLLSSFNISGVYNISVVVTNHISEVANWTLLFVGQFVEEPDTNVSLISADDIYICRRSDNITFITYFPAAAFDTILWQVIDVEAASIVSSFEEGLTNDQTNAAMSYTFDRVGMFNVVVTVRNAMSSVVTHTPKYVRVQEIVEFFYANASCYYCQSESAFELTLWVTNGTSVRFDSDIGNGRVSLAVSRVDSRKYSAQLFCSKLSDRIMLFAYNDISEANTTVYIDCQCAIPDLSLLSLGFTGSQLLLVVLNGGNF